MAEGCLLHRVVGQEEVSAEPSASFVLGIPAVAANPEWIGVRPEYIVKGNELLRRGDPPPGSSPTAV